MQSARVKRSISHTVSPRGTTRWSFIDAAPETARPSCEADCPHEEAESLWREALEMYGERAHEFAFLRTYGLGSVPHDSVSLAELRV